MSGCRALIDARQQVTLEPGDHEAPWVYDQGWLNVWVPEADIHCIVAIVPAS